MSESSEIRVRLVFDGAGGCAVMVARGRGAASPPDDLRPLAGVVADAGLRLAGLSVASSDAAPPGAGPSARGRSLAGAVRRALAVAVAAGATS
jgi:hypothetical protein